MIGSIRSPGMALVSGVPSTSHAQFAVLKQQHDPLRNSKDRCSFRNSTVFGAEVKFCATSSREVSTVIRRGRETATRAQASENGNSQLPSSHKLKVASAASFAQLLQHARSNRYRNVKSRILVLGLSVHTTPVSMREKLAIPEAEWPRAIEELCEHNHIEEAAVLSTCNRLEIYVVALSWNLGVQEVTQWMSKTSSIAVQDLREHLFILRDRDATQHLFRVASGLDSLVLGEGQILSQVKQVYKVGQSAPKFGRNLHGLFKQAITAGKRVRSETSIGAGAVSVSSAAVELAVMKLPEQHAIGRANVLIVGAGKMSKLLVKHLISKGCTKVVIVNRTEQKVRDLQAEFEEAELVYRPSSEMMECAGEADVIFTSTASEVPLFHRKDVERLSTPASGVSCGVRLFIDISMPRNVSADIAEVKSTRLYNVDDLREVVAANTAERKRKAVEAQIIIEQELQSFEAWRDSLETVPTIKKLRAHVEGIRVTELDKCLGKMGGDATKKNRRLVDDLTRGIVNKLLHGPMQHLRSDGSDARTVNETLENMHVLERMFDLRTHVGSVEENLGDAAAERMKR